MPAQLPCLPPLHMLPRSAAPLCCCAAELHLMCTLLSLCCLRQGVQLVVRHAGQEVTVDLSGPRGAKTTCFAAFYAGTRSCHAAFVMRHAMP